MKAKSKEEPKIVVRPIGALGGLDNIHLALLALVIILILIILVISYSKPVVIRNATSNLTCTYGAVNGTCVVPKQGTGNVTLYAERALASYAYVNGSLSLLPYFSNVKNLSVLYLPSGREWYVSVPVTNPATNTIFTFSFLISDSNLSVVTPLIQTVKTSNVFGNYVVSQGVVRVNGKVMCQQQAPLQMYWFADPYAPGSVGTLGNLTSLQSKYGKKLNASLEVLFGSYSQSVASRAGINNTLLLNKYLLCASKQSNFSRFVTNLVAVYSNNYIPQSLLASMVNQSRLNNTQFSVCLSNVTSRLNAQAFLAQYYNITSTPTIITNCVYMSIPQTVNRAMCFSNSTFC